MGDQTQVWVRQFKSNLTHVVQQMASQAEGMVTVERDGVGEMAFFDYLGKLDPVARTERLAKTVLQDHTTFRRRVSPVIYDTAVPVDEIDLQAMLTDPSSKLMEAIRAGLGRKKDLVIYAAANGTAYTGKEGTTTVALPSAQKVAVGGTGLTKAKVIEAAKILNEAEVPETDRWFAIGPEQLEDLQGITEFTSRDYNMVATLVSGRPAQWLGFNFILTNRLTLSGSNRLCLAWHKSGIGLKFWKDVQGSVDKRPDLNNINQVLASMSLGATRLEEEKVVEVSCAE